MIRFITSIVAFLGYVLSGLLAYFVFVPVDFREEKSLDFSEVVSCNSRVTTFRFINFSQDEKNRFNNLIGIPTPIDQVISIASKIDEVATLVGRKSVINAEYCDTSDENTLNLSSIRNYLSKRSKYFEFGSIDNLASNVSSLPLAQIANVEVNVKSIFARTNFCNTSTVNAKLYLFIVVDSKISTLKKVVLFTIKLEPTGNLSFKEKAIANLIQAGQYFKSIWSCNE